MPLTLVGLGYGAAHALTREAEQTLRRAREIFVTTRTHPALSVVPAAARVHWLNAADPARASRVAAAVVRRAREGAVVYATPGDPWLDDANVPQILAQARTYQIATRVVAGVSWVEGACAALGISPHARGLQLADARVLAQQYFPRLDPDQPALIGHVATRQLARACQRALRWLYPREHTIQCLDAEGTPAARTLESAHTHKCNAATVWYVPPLAQAGGLSALGQVVAHLRAPTGCPWDRAQTHQSLRKDFLEECYEVLETLDANDVPHLREELGDLLLHIFLQAQIAAEAGEFLLTDVIADIAAKLVRRHPHVFGDVKVNSTDEIFANWERIKRDERNGAPARSRLPRAFPALTRAQKAIKRAKRTATPRDVQRAVARLARAPTRERAFGEALLALAALATARGVDAESALRTAVTALE